MKTIKSLTEAELSELPKLPEGWEWARFEEIIENFDGKRKPLSSKFRESFKGEYPYYGACDIIDYVREYIFDGEYLLIGEDGANLLSKAKPLAFSVKGKFWVNNHAHIVKAANGVNQKYLEFQFNALQINKYVTGTAQPKLNQSNLNRISIAICPLPEQRAIVSKIELLFSELDNGIANLKLAQAQLKVYRQAVLKKAFEGDWGIVTVGDKFDFVGGGTPSKKEPKYWNGEILWCSVKDVKGKYLHSTIDKITNEGLKNSASNLAKVDEVILVTRISPGKTIIVKTETAINQDLKIGNYSAY